MNSLFPLSPILPTIHWKLKVKTKEQLQSPIPICGNCGSIQNILSCPMCYPREHPGRFVPLDEGQRGVAREQVHIQAVSRVVSNGNGSSTAAGMMKQCVCSPTHHPGSFRCRYHHADYKWAAQLGTNKTTH